jgi:hypothetical protein
MKKPKLFHSLTRWWCAVPTIDDMSTNYRLNERAETIPFTYSMMMCCSNNRRHVYNITSWMKDPILFHSLTRWWSALPTIDDTSTISHVKWKARFYSIHLLDDDVLFQQQTICQQYYRLNEKAETLAFSYSVMMCCSNNRRYVSKLQVEWKSWNYSIYLLDNDVLFQQ